MPRETRRSPYTYVTWITSHLAGDDSCWRSPWLKSHYKLDLIDDGGFDLIAWKAQHAVMVEARAAELRVQGWGISLEDQNFLTLRGRVGTLAGKPDIVAEKGGEVLIVDCKGGKRRGSDAMQVLVYMFALPFVRERYRALRISGEVHYRDGRLTIPAEDLTDELRQRIRDAMLAVSGPEAPAAVPSSRECSFCKISSTDCAARVEGAPAAAAVDCF